MLLKRKFILPVFLLTWLTLMSNGGTTPPRMPWPFEVERETVPYPSRGGPVTLRLTVTPRLGEYDRFSIEITRVDNLTYNGPMTFEVR
jgi:hypothetical protein